MWGFQLWVNLPASDKMTAPRYQDIPAEEIPAVEPEHGVHARVIAGSLAGVDGPVSGVATDPIYLDLAIDEDVRYSLSLPAGHNAFVYLYQGSATIGASRTFIQRGELALLTHGDELPIEAVESCRCIVVAGRPLNEPIARYGPFVMNTREELYKAFEDYQAGRL
jgi:redox-sensitive bicupin YhaK (pirin superfamily)